MADDSMPLSTAELDELDKWVKDCEEKHLLDVARIGRLIADLRRLRQLIAETLPQVESAEEYIQKRGDRIWVITAELRGKLKAEADRV